MVAFIFLLLKLTYSNDHTQYVCTHHVTEHIISILSATKANTAEKNPKEKCKHCISNPLQTRFNSKTQIPLYSIPYTRSL